MLTNPLDTNIHYLLVEEYKILTIGFELTLDLNHFSFRNNMLQELFSCAQKYIKLGVRLYSEKRRNLFSCIKFTFCWSPEALFANKKLISTES